LFHGLAGHPSDFTQAPYNLLTNQLVAAGWQVIIPALPEDNRASPDGYLEKALRTDGGRAYLATWLAEVKVLTHTYGPGVFGGVSWGGWHAAWAAKAQGGRWFALSPVTQVSYLSEFHSADTTAIDLTALPPNGIVAWGTADTRVGWQATARMTMQAGDIGVQIPDMPHTIQPGEITRVVKLVTTSQI